MTAIPISLLRDESIPNAACRLHCQLLALAWGKASLEMALPALLAALSLSRTRLFAEARLLSLHGYLIWSCLSGVFKGRFADPGIPESRIPGKRDSTSLKSLNHKDSDSIKEGGQIPESGIAGKRDSRARKPADPRTQSPEIQLFRAVVGRYPAIVNYDEVIVVARGRTREQLEPYYREWSARGYNPGSIKWLTDWTASGLPPGQCGRKNGASAPARSASAAAARPQLSPQEIQAIREKLRAQAAADAAEGKQEPRDNTR
jgi:hypothetical protein